MILSIQTTLALAAAAAVVALTLATGQDPDRAISGCDTDTDCLVKFCMNPGATCDGGPEPATR